MPYFAIIYLTIYILVIMYYVLLGCWMFATKDSTDSTRGELDAKRRMVYCVGACMILWAFEYIICMPFILLTTDTRHPSFKICFLLSTMLHTPMFYVVIRVLLQRWKGTIWGACMIGLPFLLINVWYILSDWNSMLHIRIAVALCVACVIFSLVKYAKDYRTYIRRLQSEYSETTGRDIFWSCWCIAGFALQILIYVVYVFYWNLLLDVGFMCLSIVNAAYICYCTRRHKAMDRDIITENVEEIEETIPVEVAPAATEDEKAFYSIVEQKLESLCEKELFFLEPDLTRESLCQRLSIGRTYLSLYLRSRGLTFYQYINTLRVKHAIKLMRDNPELSINGVSQVSGFRSQTTFRKVFKEVMGCLPSELKNYSPQAGSDK